MKRNVVAAYIATGAVLIGVGGYLVGKMAGGYNAPHSADNIASSSVQAAPPSTEPVTKTDTSGADAIDSQNALNHRTCIAGGGIWDSSVSTPTEVPGHPFVGTCTGKTARPVCAGRDSAKCWKFVEGDPHAKANPKWKACRGDDPDPLCGSAED